MFATQPFLRFIFPLVTGIVAIDFLSDKFGSNFPNLSLFLLLALLCGVVGAIWTNRSTQLRSFFLVITIFWLGAYVTERKRVAFKSGVTGLETLEYDRYLINIKSLGQKRKASVKYDAEAVAIDSGNRWVEIDSRIQVSFPNSTKVLPSAGDWVLVKGVLPKRPAIPLNPDEFDYRRYLQRQGIAWTVFLPENSYKILTSRKLSVSYWATNISQKADSVFKTQLKNPTSYGLLKAMVLGRRDDLGTDLLSSYINSGAVHVLAVSGLHVGVFFFMISLLLAGLRKNKWGRWLYLMLIISLLSSYAIVTGLSPSVVRASLMCVTFATSQTFSRKHYGVNVLSISALIILLIDPMALFSVGFQLSYAAVLGIILFYPLCKDIIQTEVLLFRWLWQITVISFSAQVFTFPISIYYFHQFPTYFWLVNPFVIGLTTVLIYSAVVMLIFSGITFQPIRGLIAYWTDGVAQTMNSIVKIPQQMPNYLQENLNFDLVEVIILLVFMLLFYKLLKEKELARLKAAAICSFCFFSYATARSFNSFTTPRMLVHSVPKHTVLSATQGQTAYVLADPEFKSDTLAYVFHLEDYFNAQGIRQIEYLDLPDKSENSPVSIRWRNQALTTDAQVFSGSNNFSLIRSRKYPKAETLVTAPNTTFLLSQELGFKTRNQWKMLLGKAGNATVDLTKSGAIEF